jgi:poly(3-hydroxybutyrate) depolymerase
MRVKSELRIWWIGLLLLFGCTDALGAGRGAVRSQVSESDNGFTCLPDGAPPIRTVSPVTRRPFCEQGHLLSFDQEGITRYACLNLPQQAEEQQTQIAGNRWPLLIYLHGSLVTPDSLYTLGRGLFNLHHVYPLSADPDVLGFILLSPEGRNAVPWPSSSGPETGQGFHWDSWYRNPTDNLDALAIDHFVNEVVATRPVDPARIYVFGWSNGAYMAVLYGVWRSDRIAGIAQYAGADSWKREPCPVPLEYNRQVPLVLLRNLCDTLVPCDATNEWIDRLTSLGWPFEFHSLNLTGTKTDQDRVCAKRCSRRKGLWEHFRWPAENVLAEDMLSFLKQHTLP